VAAGSEGDDDDDDTASLASSGPAGSLASTVVKPPPGLALYGRGNHADGAAAAAGGGCLGPADAATLAARAATLVALFAPFALLAPVLLALAALAPRSAPGRAATTAAWALLLAAIRAAGPAFIKWGQWAAVRGDLFPPSLAAALGGLHDAAPVHGWPATRAALEAAFGGPAGVAARFAHVDRAPLASGSVAQVHRALMRTGGGGGGGGGGKGGGLTPVALKVRHPGVARRLAADFALLKPLAAWAEAHAPGLRGLPLSASLAQFTATMTAQADLRVEAAHLHRFAADLGRRGGGGCPPGAAPAPRPAPSRACPRRRASWPKPLSRGAASPPL
jgi:aarF domain-containing kinase